MGHKEGPCSVTSCIGQACSGFHQVGATYKKVFRLLRVSQHGVCCSVASVLASRRSWAQPTVSVPVTHWAVLILASWLPPLLPHSALFAESVRLLKHLNMCIKWWCPCASVVRCDTHGVKRSVKMAALVASVYPHVTTSWV